MRKAALYILLLIFLLPSCSKHSNGTVAVVKPKPFHRFYDRKKDKKVKRTRVVRMKN